MRDDNDPELNGKYLGTITKDFVKVSETLKEASYQVRSRKFSEFPIFPVCKTEQPIGQLLIGNTDVKVDWNYYITYLDEFVQRKLVDQEAIEDFKGAYKNPDEYCCLFVVDQDFTNFVYIPYPNE
ncbi:hypothetical protein [Echinicola rosea]|uniref:Uncharacterized protein n=1 Tax=Echinicola rosea TaxID=1807691 RepID=A0ABQ1UKB2_9BACT|nr:hypothetical protein [Echinicola rosea]GGF20235.1 hypothetical protein GCM10011339_05330 [Echinicola rosea]